MGEDRKEGGGREEQSGVKQSGVEQSGVEQSGVEQSGPWIVGIVYRRGLFREQCVGCAALSIYEYESAL